MLPTTIYKSESDWAIFSDATWTWKNRWMGFNHGNSPGNFYAKNSFNSAPAAGTKPSGIAELKVDGSGKWYRKIEAVVITPWAARIFQAK
jgi:hypothetical protein